MRVARQVAQYAYMYIALEHITRHCHHIYLLNAYNTHDILSPFKLYMFPSTVPPMIEATSSEMSINISEPATLVCLITGYPHPSITWEKNDGAFSTNSTRIDIFDFEVGTMDSGSGPDIGYMSSGFTGSGSIANLLR